MQFSNLSGAHITKDTTARFTFDSLPGSPWVQVKMGGELNKPYFSEVWNANAKNRKKLARGKLDPEMLRRNRELDRKLFPKYIDGGEWGGWEDTDGLNVPYTPDGFRELIEQLPDDLFDELRAFCGEPENFRSVEVPDEEDFEDTLGN